MIQESNKVKELLIKIKKKKYWNISLKYSKLLNKNIENKNIIYVCNNIYSIYINKIKSDKLLHFETNVWNEIFVNCKKKNIKHLKNTIHKLHITNLYNIKL